MVGLLYTHYLSPSVSLCLSLSFCLSLFLSLFLSLSLSLSLCLHLSQFLSFRRLSFSLLFVHIFTHSNFFFYDLFLCFFFLRFLFLSGAYNPYIRDMPIPPTKLSFNYLLDPKGMSYGRYDSVRFSHLMSLIYNSEIRSGRDR